jgi:hypothetical protein
VGDDDEGSTPACESSLYLGFGGGIEMACRFVENRDDGFGQVAAS